jgi:hypothetical protein
MVMALTRPTFKSLNRPINSAYLLVKEGAVWQQVKVWLNLAIREMEQVSATMCESIHMAGAE